MKNYSSSKIRGRNETSGPQNRFPSVIKSQKIFRDFLRDCIIKKELSNKFSCLYFIKQAMITLQEKAEF